MSIYKDLLDAVSNGKKFKVDLINKSLWIDRKQIIKEGVIVRERDVGKNLINNNDLKELLKDMNLDTNPWDCIDVLYNEFRHSCPKEKSMKKSYFKAPSLDELTDADLAYGYDLDLCQAMLEGYILLGVLIGWIKWDFGNHWFYQGKNESLVIIRNWIE